MFKSLYFVYLSMLSIKKDLPVIGTVMVENCAVEDDVKTVVGTSDDE